MDDAFCSLRADEDRHSHMSCAVLLKHIYFKSVEVFSNIKGGGGGWQLDEKFSSPMKMITTAKMCHCMELL